ncbi:hypothetical protein [Cellulomonas soli]|uniref:hypothetical protein n=1 Tax=Cellulomonas soli TaxID=931535 RepID=UPI0011BF2B03|nr:hypothetical protein [Cellulomonas soli]NYI59167.1 hypothetical protein [Cellulomonas soli]
MSSRAAPAATTAPVADDTPAPDATTAPVADAYSQVINGVLYQGTETAPVRIGTDTPGQAPAYEVEFLAAGREGSTARAEASGKYLVYVSTASSGGYQWKVFGLSKYGSFRELSNFGYGASTIPTREEAAAGPFTVDGRALDRAEYLLAVD